MRAGRPHQHRPPSCGTGRRGAAAPSPHPVRRRRTDSRRQQRKDEPTAGPPTRAGSGAWRARAKGRRRRPRRGQAVARGPADGRGGRNEQRVARQHRPDRGGTQDRSRATPSGWVGRVGGREVGGGARRPHRSALQRPAPWRRRHADVRWPCGFSADGARQRVSTVTLNVCRPGRWGWCGCARRRGPTMPLDRPRRPAGRRRPDRPDPDAARCEPCAMPDPPDGGERPRADRRRNYPVPTGTARCVPVPVGPASERSRAAPGSGTARWAPVPSPGKPPAPRP